MAYTEPFPKEELDKIYKSRVMGRRPIRAMVFGFDTKEEASIWYAGLPRTKKVEYNNFFKEKENAE